MEKFLMNLFIAGLILILLGIMLILIDTVVNNKHISGVVFIGPFPIVFGEFPIWLAIGIGLIILILFYILPNFVEKY